MDYTFGTVPAASIAAMTASLIISIGFPVFLAVFWKKKMKAALSPFFIGIAVFAVVVTLIESLFHQLVFSLTGTAITGNIYLYALYGGLAAGIFEESGRLLVMKKLMKKRLNPVNAVMYGIGHGGGEAILLVGVTFITNLIFTALINTGVMSELLTGLAEAFSPNAGGAAAEVGKTLADTLYTQFEPLCTIGWEQFLFSGIERISAILLHIGLTYIVYLGVKHSKISRYFIAIGIHALVDTVTVLLVNRFNVPPAVFELGLLAVTAGFCAVVFRKFRESDADSCSAVTGPEQSDADSCNAV